MLPTRSPFNKKNASANIWLACLTKDHAKASAQALVEAAVQHCTKTKNQKLDHTPAQSTGQKRVLLCMDMDMDMYIYKERVDMEIRICMDMNRKWIWIGMNMHHIAQRYVSG